MCRWWSELLCLFARPDALLEVLNIASAAVVLALFGTIFAYAAAIGIGPAGGETMPSFNWLRLLEMAPRRQPLAFQARKRIVSELLRVITGMFMPSHEFLLPEARLLRQSISAV